MRDGYAIVFGIVLTFMVIGAGLLGALVISAYV